TALYSSHTSARLAGCHHHGDCQIRAMSALGPKQTFRQVRPMSALSPKTDIGRAYCDVCYGPIGDIDRVRISLVNGTVKVASPDLRLMRQLLGIDLNVLRPRLVEKYEYQGIAGLRHCIAALARYLSGYAACIFRNHLAEAIALDGNLLPGFNLFVELDQMLNETARGG